MTLILGLKPQTIFLEATQSDLIDISKYIYVYIFLSYHYNISVDIWKLCVRLLSSSVFEFVIIVGCEKLTVFVYDSEFLLFSYYDYEGTLTFNVMFSHQSPVIYVMYTHKISFLSKMYGMLSYFCRKNNFHFSFQVNFFLSYLSWMLFILFFGH